MEKLLLINNIYQQESEILINGPLPIFKMINHHLKMSCVSEEMLVYTGFVLLPQVSPSQPHTHIHTLFYHTILCTHAHSERYIRGNSAFRISLKDSSTYGHMATFQLVDKPRYHLRPCVRSMCRV